MSSKDFDKKVVDVLKAARDVSGLADDSTLMQQLTPEMIKKQAEALEADAAEANEATPEVAPRDEQRDAAIMEALAQAEHKK